MGCLTVIINRIGDGITAAYGLCNDEPVVSFTPDHNRLQAAFTLQEPTVAATFTKTGGMTARYGLVCGTNLGDGFLFASDALLITLENGKLKVQQV